MSSPPARFLGGLLRRRPDGTPAHDEAGRESVRHLQGLYTVAVGLAMTVGVERTLPVDFKGHLVLRVGLVFVAFLATLVPFYHGALRHLDLNYVFDVPTKRPQGMFFGDFVFLFIEACLLIAMGASVAQPSIFLEAWTALLTLDVLWLMVFIFGSGAMPGQGKSRWQLFGWAVVNIPAILAGGLVLLSDAVTDAGLAASAVVLLLCSARTALDYTWNWHFYFPETDIL